MPSNDQIVLNQILNQRKQEVASDLNDSLFFEIFTAEQILKNYDLSYEEILSGIVGGGGDGGIDSIFLFINSDLTQEDSELSGLRGNIEIELHFVQSKASASFSESTVEKFRSSTEDLLDLSKDLKDFVSVYDRSVINIVSRFRDVYTRYAGKFPKLNILYYYATKGDSDEVHQNVKRKVQKLKECVSKLYSHAQFSFDFLGARKLIDLAYSLPSASYSVSLAETPISTGNESFVCLVRLRNYFNLVTDAKGRLIKSLFEANVRDYQGDVQVNQGIKDTLVNSQGEDFWWLNNGVTVVASKATLSGKTLTLEGAQIVNGLQTSTEIFKYFKSEVQSDDGRNILIRVIVAEDTASRDRIIKATNRQTALPEASLRSTDQIHRDIEEYFRSNVYYYDRRKKLLQARRKTFE